MKTCVCSFGFCISLLALTAAFAQPAPAVAAEETMRGIPLDEFGEGGGRLPELARYLLPEDFFSQGRPEALANRENYTALWEIPQTRELMSMDGRGHARSVSVAVPSDERWLRFFLGNPGMGRADVVVVTFDSRGGEARSYLAGLEGGGRLVIDAGPLEGFDRLAFLSLMPFTATVEARLAQEGPRQQDLAVMAPSRPVTAALHAAKAAALSSSVYCAEVGRYVDVCLAGSCVTAWAERYERLCCWAPGEPVYYVNVDYPLKGDDFHIGNGAAHSPLDPELCRQSASYTHRPEVGKEHRWNGLDDTLFLCEASTAECTYGCSETFDVTCH